MAGDEDETHYSLDSTKDTSTGCDTELQETITPSLFLRQNKNTSSLQSYMISFDPVPDDRKYTKFALVLRSHLPKDAADICEELQLPHAGMTVSCKLTSTGAVYLNPSQVTQAEKFQLLLFSAFLDTYPSLEKRFSVNSGWYLLLPLMNQGLRTNPEFKIDWETINGVLQSANQTSHRPNATCSSPAGMRALGLHDGLRNAANLIPSFMHKLEGILIATQLRDVLSSKFLEGSRVSVHKVLEALTTKKCGEQFSLERLELLGDSFLKYSVSCHLFLAYHREDEGFLSSQRARKINNELLYNLGRNLGLPGHIRDSLFRSEDWISPCHPSKFICDDRNIDDLHGEFSESKKKGYIFKNCNKRHRWMQRKTVADVVEALIGAYLVDGGQGAALAFMRCLGLEVDKTFALVSNIHNSSQKNLSRHRRFDIGAVENLLGYSFMHEGLLIEAFTHASSNKHPAQCYQRLEFLGDSVLDYLITRYYYEMFPHLNPGQLTDLRSASVNNDIFARVAVQQKLHLHLIADSMDLFQRIREFVIYIQENESCDWSGDRCTKVLSDLVESSAGAVTVDSGFDLDIVWKVFEPILNLDNPISRSPVRELYELCQRNHFEHKFEELLHHGTVFKVKVRVNTGNDDIEVHADAKNKKSAKKEAAYLMLCKLKKLGYVHVPKGFIGSQGSSSSNKVDPKEFVGFQGSSSSNKVDPKGKNQFTFPTHVQAESNQVWECKFIGSQGSSSSNKVDPKGFVGSQGSSSRNKVDPKGFVGSQGSSSSNKVDPKGKNEFTHTFPTHMQAESDQVLERKWLPIGLICAGVFAYYCWDHSLKAKDKNKRH